MLIMVTLYCTCRLVNVCWPDSSNTSEQSVSAELGNAVVNHLCRPGEIESPASNSVDETDTVDVVCLHGGVRGLFVCVLGGVISRRCYGV